MAADRKQAMFASCCFFLCQILISVYGRKTRDMIYVDIKHFAPCIRRFNATHEIGCTSSTSGNTGVVHYINDTGELDYVLNTGPHQPYIPIMTPETFNLTNVEKLLASNKINGIIVVHSNVSQVLEEDLNFSADRSCPNDNFGIYNEDNNTYAHCNDITWNPDGNSLNYMNLEVPVFALLDQSEVDFLVDCALTFNHPIDGEVREYPLCAVELYNFMFGAKDTPTCIWRSQRITGLEQTYFCDPLGGYNTFATLKPTNKKEPLEEKSVVFAAAQLDATSLFYDNLPRGGADNAVTSFVTLLAAAHALGKVPNDTKEGMNNIMFAFFTGESYDYIGSSRMVYDMQRDQFPMELSDKDKDKNKQQPALMNLTHISHFVELRQVGLTKDSNTIWAHSDPVSQEDADTRKETEAIVAALKAGATPGGMTVNTPDQSQSLPPASFQRFLRENRMIPGIVLTDHDKQYANKYYNSRFDVSVWVDPAYKDVNETDVTQLAEDLTEIATIVARALYKLAKPNNTGDLNSVTADVDMVNSMLYCFLYRPNCTLFKSVGSPDEAQSFSYINTPYSNYVGVYDGYGTISPVTSIVKRLLAYFTGETTITPAKSEKECKKHKDDEIFTYNYIQGPDFNETHGLCLKSTSQVSPAESPAFINDTKESWGSTEYSTWTESRWSSYSARIFLKPSREQESIIFSLGMIVILFSLTVSYFLNARASIIFAPNRTTY